MSAARSQRPRTRPVLYYVRHGETDWNVAQRWQGVQDVAINAVGRQQAETCGRILHDLFRESGRRASAHDFVSSPLVRARVTMELVRKAIALPPAGYAIDIRLTEIGLGGWEGLTSAEFLAREPGHAVARETDKWNFEPPGGESYRQVMERVAAWYATMDRDTVVTSHGGVARALLAFLEIMPPEAALRESIEQGVVYALVPGRVTRYA